MGTSPRRSFVSAPREMERVLSTAPRAKIVLSSLGDAGVELPSATLQIWHHGALHDGTRPMVDHVVMTYLEADTPIERVLEGRRERSTARPGTVTTIPSASESAWDIERGLAAVHLYVAPAALARCAPELVGRDRFELAPRTATPDPLGSTLLRTLAEPATQDDRLFLDRAYALFLHHLLRAHGTEPTKNVPAPRGGLAPWQLKRTIERLSDQVASNVGLAELAADAGLSVFHFCRAFKRSTGVPPHQWRQMRRVERGRELLDTTDKGILEIALEVGYQDASKFTATFRKRTGMTPSQYRRSRGRPSGSSG